MADPPSEPPQLVRQNGVYTPAVLQADSPVLTQRFRRLSAQKPQLPVVVAHTTRRFNHFRGTRDRHNVVQILLYILESFEEEDPTLKKTLQDLAFSAVCAELGIEKCIYSEISNMISKCCKSVMSCLPCH